MGGWQDPRWGRNQETVSEDPLVCGEYGAQWSLGMQFDRGGSDTRPPPAQPSSGDMMAVATIKHVLGYSLEQWSPDGNWSEDVYDRINFVRHTDPLPLCAMSLAELDRVSAALSCVVGAGRGDQPSGPGGDIHAGVQARD